jgi:tRNA (guanine-N(7)-)-methyltransferase subunit TRM82
MAAVFSPDNKTIVFADKFGDVLTFDFTSNEKERLVMGHYASITDMILSPDGKYLITSDKDEHIRVSHYPEVYDIKCYCFGHTDFVSGLMLLPYQPELLISGGGDGSLRLWHWQSGNHIDIFRFDRKEVHFHLQHTVFKHLFQCRVKRRYPQLFL